MEVANPVAGTQQLLDAVATDPDRERVTAFFDFDRTLIDGFSYAAFVRAWWNAGHAGTAELLQTASNALSFGLGLTPYEELMTGAVSALRGRTEEEVREDARQIYRRELSDRIYPEARKLLHAHREQGHRVVIVSAASRYQIEPAAASLGIREILCSELEVEGGRLSGRLAGPPCYGPGKLAAARAFAAKNDTDLERSYFYTDGTEDIPLLEVVGKPRVLNPSPALAAEARERRWLAAHLQPTTSSPADDALRSAASALAVVPAAITALPAALASRFTPADAWQASRLLEVAERTQRTAETIWNEVALLAAAADPVVHGEQHLWAHRPAVFLWNRSSTVDEALLARLLRRDVCFHEDPGSGPRPEVDGPPPANDTGPGMPGLDWIPRVFPLPLGSRHFTGNSSSRNAAGMLRQLRDGVSVVVSVDEHALTADNPGFLRAAETAGVPVVAIVLSRSPEGQAPAVVTVHPPRRIAPDQPLSSFAAALQRLYRSGN